MDGPGDQFFAGTCLTSDQDCGVGVGYGLDHLENFLHGFTPADDILELILLGQPFPEQDIFRDQLLMFHDPLEH